MVTWAVRCSLLGAVLLALLLPPAAAAAPEDSETCEHLLVVAYCEGTRSDASSSCTENPSPPGTNATSCSSTQTDEEYRRVEVLGVGAELAEVEHTEENTFEATDACNHEEGQATLVGHGHAVRTTSPLGGVRLETESYDVDVQEHGSSSCPGDESTETEEETVEGHSVGFGSDVGPQPVDVEVRTELSQATLQQQGSGGPTSWMNITGVLVGASVNEVSVAAVVAVYHQDDGRGCQRVGAVVFWSPILPNQGVGSGCLPTLP